MSKLQYIGGNYFIKRRFKWYLVDLKFDRPSVVAVEIEFISANQLKEISNE